MAIDDNSYGDLASIGALVPRYANASGTFDTTTRPTGSTVETQIDQVSSIINSLLAEVGFDIPITQADAKRSVTAFVESEVASIVEGINGSGRFGPQSKTQKRPASRYRIILDDAKAFIDGNAAGIERLGASRKYSKLSSCDYRSTDDAGDDTFPIFQRKAFGNKFTNWDQ